MSERDPPTIRVRTALLEKLRDMHRQQRLAEPRRQERSTGLMTSGEHTVEVYQSEDDSEAAAPIAVRFVRNCPPLTDPAWAMEELLRICPNVTVWTGTGLSNSVWATPGSGHCPFGTTEADFVRHH